MKPPDKSGDGLSWIRLILLCRIRREAAMLVELVPAAAGDVAELLDDVAVVLS